MVILSAPVARRFGKRLRAGRLTKSENPRISAFFGRHTCYYNLASVAQQRYVPASSSSSSRACKALHLVFHGISSRNKGERVCAWCGGAPRTRALERESESTLAYIVKLTIKLLLVKYCERATIMFTDRRGRRGIGRRWLFTSARGYAVSFKRVKPIPRTPSFPSSFWNPEMLSPPGRNNTFDVDEILPWLTQFAIIWCVI